MPATHTVGEMGPGEVRRGFDAKLPVTPLGKWSMWIAAAFVVMFAINTVLVGVFGQTTNEAMQAFSQSYLPYWGIALAACGLASGIVGLIAIVRQHERSLLTLLTLIPGAFMVVFLIGEFAFPH